MSDTILTMTNINKAFPGVKALSECNFELRAGEVHALVGENGAGKSTLMKVLTGVYSKDSGVIVYNGKETIIPDPKTAQDLGICIIHQELNLMPHLTAAQNMYIGRENEKGFFINDKSINEGAKKIFESMNLNLSPQVRIADLTVAKQQMVEIAKALTFDSKILVMDEPTAALTESEIEELFHIIERLKERGVGIVYISHRMEELFQIADRVTVLRDGEYVGTKDMSETNLDEIIRMMVGRTIYHDIHNEEKPPISDEIVLEVRNMSRGRAVKNASFKLRRGEILGFAGLMGAGRTELARLIFGADKKDSGELLLNGKPIKIQTPSDAVAHGIGYLSEDRKRYGLTLGESVEDNIALASYDRYSKFGFVQYKEAREASKKYIDILKIKTPSTQQLAKFLSGGNQQKVVVAKWLLRDCDVLIFDEPTRGIDVGAKSEIYSLLDELVQQGKSIIMISSELPEILRMSDRIIVMCEGRITGELDASEATQESIMALATKREGSLNIKQKEKGLN